MKYGERLEENKMVKSALEKLNERQMQALKTYSALISRAKENGLKAEFERSSGKLRGFLECLCQSEIISGSDLKSLYLWFFEKDRSKE